MIILDENVLRESICAAIARWYTGRVRFISDLRLNSVIKDEAIPGLLMSERQPTFVTTNTTDFSQRVAPHPRYCVVCLTLPNERQDEIPDSLRRLFRMPAFRTKAARMGNVVRAAPTFLQFHRVGDNTVHTVPW
ncbi:MAG: hypothetical protein HY321_13610 [Armatimonadetes bacterium]|nr:hypothetical protein [Armatimonadota bacterium]